jgi:hypothetical protein
MTAPDLSFVDFDACPDGEPHRAVIGTYDEKPCVFCSRCRRWFCAVPADQVPKGELPVLEPPERKGKG